MIKFEDGNKCSAKQKAAEVIDSELDSVINGWIEDNSDEYTVKQLDDIENHLNKYMKRIVKLLGREEC